MKLNYFTIPLITIIVAISGSLLTTSGMDWYKTINLPSWTPGGGTISAAWTIIFTLTTISALIVWNRFPKDKRFNQIITLFVINATLNVTWSFLFFNAHLLLVSFFEAILLGLSVILLITLIRPISKTASILLFPYLGWVALATYLTLSVWKLNS